jgi:Copper transport outer membrane protein, MctB
LINLRYHIVSLTAVFLALAVGILMGSTVLDRGTVALLERSSSQLRGNLDTYRAENERFRNELGQWRQYGDQLLPAQVAGRLQGRQVVLVDIDLVDDATREAVRDVLRRAGATYDGRVTFAADRLRLQTPDDRKALADQLDLADQDPAVLQRALVDRVAARLLHPAPVPGNERDFANDPLTALRQSSFVTDLDLADPATQGSQPFPRPGSLMIVIGPSTAPRHPAAERFLVPLAGKLAVGSAQPVAAVEPTGPASWVRGLRDNDLVAGRISSVDNIDIAPGQLALVQALQQGVDGHPPGHYGSKPGATSLLPEEPAK